MDHVFPVAFHRGGSHQPDKVHLREPREGTQSYRGAAQEGHDRDRASGPLLDGKRHLLKIFGDRPIRAPLFCGSVLGRDCRSSVCLGRCCVWVGLSKRSEPLLFDRQQEGDDEDEVL